MKRNNIMIFRWMAWLCITMAACSEMEDELPFGGKANVGSSDTRSERIEYTIHVETVGSLESLVKAGSYPGAQKLIVTGNIGYEDVHYVDVNMTTVEVLDLSGSQYESTSIVGAFLSESSNIKEISLPANIESIRGDSKYDAISHSYNYYYPFKCVSLIRIILPEGLTSIRDSAFEGCSSLISINIPEGVTSFGAFAFEGCSSLTSINIPKGVTKIGIYTFDGCSSLTSIDIPEGVTSIGAAAFLDCNSLTSINIPETVISIGEATFAGCSSITNIYIPAGVTSIEQETFEGCSSLANINIPEGVTSIGKFAFYGCSFLNSINIPEAVISIGEAAFDACNSLMIIKWNTSCSITDYFSSLLGKLIIYGAEDVASSEGNYGYITTAKKVVCTKNFSSSSYNIWYTIALPFKPTQITHEEKGVIAPFKSNIEDAKKFWLRELTSGGYQSVVEMEPNHAYIIAMPTSDSYSPEFRLDGNVTFSAENVTLTWKTVPSEGSTYTMYPTYETVKRARDVYALNSEYWMDGYGYGRVFVRSAMDVEPLQAYVKLNDNAATMRSVLPVADGKRTAVRGASSSSNVVSRGVYGQRKPQIDDM